MISDFGWCGCGRWDKFEDGVQDFVHAVKLAQPSTLIEWSSIPSTNIRAGLFVENGFTLLTSGEANKSVRRAASFNCAFHGINPSRRSHRDCYETLLESSPILEIALALVHFDHLAHFIVNASHEVLLSSRSACPEKT
jgi:hypothetical protein